MKLTKDECWFLSWWIQNASLDIPREHCRPDEKKMAIVLLRLHNRFSENSEDKRRESKSGRVKMDTIDDCIKRLTKKNTHN